MAGENEETGNGGEDTKTEVTVEDLQAKLAENARQLAAERSRADTAETARRAAEQKAREAGASVQDSQINQIEAGIATLDTQLASLETEYETASAEGNHRKLGALARQIGALEARKLTLENGKVAMEAQKNAPPAARQPDGGGQDITEQVAASIASQGYHRSAQWIRNNPQFTRDPGLWRKLQAVHAMFEAEHGLNKTETDAYYAYVEGHDLIAPHLAGHRTTNGSGRTQAANGQDNGNDGGSDARSTASTGRERSAGNGADRSPPAAPPSRGGGTRGARLTLEQQEMARNSNMTDEEWAANQEALLKEGRIGPKARLN